MGLSRSRTIALDGVLAGVVDVEANIGPGLPGVHIVGMADTGIGEARARIRTAVANSHLPWPKTKVVVSMYPAALRKSGAHFDLPIALAILTAGLPEPQDGADVAVRGEIQWRLGATLMLGELGLDGSLRAVPGVIPALVAARRESGTIGALVIPPGNAAEAALLPDIPAFVASTLAEAFGWVCGRTRLPRAEEVAAAGGEVLSSVAEQPCFSDIAGQAEAKKAAEVAAAGGHHLLMVGPPGAGKSMIAARLPGIMPRLGAQESVEATAIHSIAGQVGRVVTHPPFVAPHSSVTRASLLGGGSGNPRPGAVSLAHHGILFLDEASEISAEALDGLRVPLEEGQVRIVRSRREVVYPARFQLILAANPCRCGAETAAACRCTSRDRQRYLSNLSGPLRDRLDMTIEVAGASKSLSAAGEESSAHIAERVASARERAAFRWERAGLDVRVNAAVPTPRLRRDFGVDEESSLLLGAYLAEGTLSQRGLDRTLKLSWTLADLEGVDRPGMAHVSAALDLRGTGRLEAVLG